MIVYSYICHVMLEVRVPWLNALHNFFFCFRFISTSYFSQHQSHSQLNYNMGLSSILLRIEKKGRVEFSAPVSTPITTNAKSNGAKIVTQRSASHRPVDPVVARLKEKRRLEREEKERVERERKGLKPFQKKTGTGSTTATSAPRTQQKQRTSRPQSQSQAQAQSQQRSLPLPPPKKQLNYAELMKKASAINKDKLSINLLNKNKSPEAQSQKETTKSQSKTSTRPLSKTSTNKPAHKPNHAVRASPQHPPPPPKPVVRTPLPMRQQSNKIKERLEQKKKSKPASNYDDDDDDDDLDSFVEDDEEEEDYDDTHRSEIWAMFNRGKKRSYYADDYDSDDMEATGAEIFDEEFQSRLDAEREDRREMEEEKKLQALKRKRLGRR